jgi:hypothetical protein
MATYTQIGSAVTVGSGGASSIDFTSIPSTYTDLVLVLSGRGAASNVYNYARLRFNGDTGNNYQMILLYGDGGTPGTTSVNPGTSIVGGLQAGQTSTANTFSNTQWYIPNYAGSTTKSVAIDAVSENNGTAGSNGYLTAARWTSTSAITSISLFIESATFVQYSTAYLYGVSNA